MNMLPVKSLLQEIPECLSWRCPVVSSTALVTPPALCPCKEDAPTTKPLDHPSWRGHTARVFSVSPELPTFSAVLPNYCNFPHRRTFIHPLPSAGSVISLPSVRSCHIPSAIKGQIISSLGCHQTPRDDTKGVLIRI